MRIEHFAFNVPDPLAMARWYVDHLGFSIKRRVMQEPWAHFLLDESGSVMIEIYGNKAEPIPDYHQIATATLHLAFVCKDVAVERERLLAAGATAVSAGVETLPSGDTMAFLRDPWGFTLQLIKRVQPMLG